MHYFYDMSQHRPRILALTASPVERAKGEPTTEKVKSDLQELQQHLADIVRQVRNPVLDEKSPA